MDALPMSNQDLRQRDEAFMRKALEQAREAYDKDEVPVGAVVVCGDRIIARAHNLTELLNDVTAHAEMQAVTALRHRGALHHVCRCAGLGPAGTARLWRARPQARIFYLCSAGAPSQDRGARRRARGGMWRADERILQAQAIAEGNQ